MARLLIVDGHAYAYRAFHAIRALRSPTGEPTNAVFGFIKMLAKMRATLAPSHLIVVWDGGLSAERMSALPISAASGRCRRIWRLSLTNWSPTWAAGWPHCGDGVEADDYIACGAAGGAAGVDVVIASSDKDFMQLVSPRIGC
jgi:DNA polymerase-1